MRFDVRQLSTLRRQGLLAARAAMSRSRQAGIGMAVALLISGQFTGLRSASETERRDDRIYPGPVDYVRAVEQGLTFPATALQRDAAMSVARREAAAVMAGFAGTVTAVAVSEPTTSGAEAIAATDTGLPQDIAQDEERISRPALRSKTGEAIAVDPKLLALVPASQSRVEAGTLAFAEQTDAGRAAEIQSVMVQLAFEAHSRSGRPGMTAQAMSEYLSLYALKERVADIGRSLASDSPETASGLWVVNLGDGMDDALSQGGFAFGQTSNGAIAGLDGVSQNVLFEGDQLVYGGFAGAFSLVSEAAALPALQSADTRGGTLGLFAVLDNGPFSVSAMMRADVSETFDALAPNRLDVSSAMQVLKAEVVARYRFDVSDWTVEPSAGVSFAKGRREIVGLSPATPQIEEAESLRLQLGVRASGVVYNRSGTSVEPSVTIMIAEELRDSGDVAFLGSSPNAAAEPVRGKTVGSVSIGVDVKDDSGWTGFVRADGQVSDEDKPSAGVSAGVKTQW